MDNVLQLNKPPMSDARLKCFSDYTPVRDVEVVDVKQRIFKGNRVIEEGTPDNVMTVIYFRRVDKVRQDLSQHTSASGPSEMEQLWPELHFHDHTILGYEFYLIPKVKMLFGYDPPSSTIVKAPMQRKTAGPFGR